MDLTRDAMLVSLRINNWSGRRYDREASHDVAVRNDADPSAGRYNKRLLPKPAFADMTKTMSKARALHYDNTLPWDDTGARLLTVANYDHYTATIDELAEQLVTERNVFIADYGDNIDQARIGLGGLFRIDDYPSQDSLRHRFAIRYRIVPVPDADISSRTSPPATRTASSATSSTSSRNASKTPSPTFTSASAKPWTTSSSVSTSMPKASR